jgi:hypothetical protein
MGCGGVKVLQWLCIVGCARFVRANCRCAVHSGARWFSGEIWKLLVVS